jgi:hypothetical protein
LHTVWAGRQIVCIQFVQAAGLSHKICAGCAGRLHICGAGGPLVCIQFGRGGGAFARPSTMRRAWPQRTVCWDWPQELQAKRSRRSARVYLRPAHCHGVNETGPKRPMAGTATISPLSVNATEGKPYLVDDQQFEKCLLPRGWQFYTLKTFVGNVLGRPRCACHTDATSQCTSLF